MPMFGKFGSENFIREICLCLQHSIYLPNTYIINKDDFGVEMFFIAEGQVSVVAGDKRTVLKKLVKGSFFGEIAIFKNVRRTTNVRSDTYCSVYVLKKGDIDSILKSYGSIA